MAHGDRTPLAGVLIRLPGLVRAMFYTSAISSALIAIFATNAAEDANDSMMLTSWYLMMASLVLFGLMVLVNFLVAQRPAPRATARREPRDRRP